MTSLKDIAAEVGVSPSLVSKVLNNRMGNTGTREEVAEEIRAAARRMGYRKNRSASALRTGRQHVIGAFIHRHGQAGSGITERIVAGLSSAATRWHQRMILDFFEDDEAFLAFRDWMVPSQMDGLIIGGLPHAELREEIEAVQRGGVPVVTILPHPLSDCLPNVGMDEQQIGLMATEHLIERGCRTLAHIADFKAREQGFYRAVRASGLNVCEELIYRGGGTLFSFEKGRAAARHWLAAGTSFDGVVAQSDEEALGVMTELQLAGLSVPDQVKVIGVDNAPYADFFPVSLTSVSQLNMERGRQAVHMLMDRIRGERITSISLHPKIVERASTRA